MKQRLAARQAGIRQNGYRPAQPQSLALAKVLLLGLSQLSSVTAHPIRTLFGIQEGDDLPKDPDDPSLWLYLLIAAILVLLGGAFAGLTIA